jgi:hypothetical protein
MVWCYDMITEKKMWKKTLLGLSSVFLIFMAYEVFPIYANLTPRTIISIRTLSLMVQDQNITARAMRELNGFWKTYFKQSLVMDGLGCGVLEAGGFLNGGGKVLEHGETGAGSS